MAVRKFKTSWWVDLRWNYVRYRKRSPVNTRGGAQAYEATLRQQLASGSSLPIGPHVEEKAFAAFAEVWMDRYVTLNNKASGCRTKSIILRAHLIPHFGNLRLSQIGGEQIEIYKQKALDAGQSRKSVNNHLGILSKCLRTALEWDLLRKVPRIKFLRVLPSPYDYLTFLESHQLLTRTLSSRWNVMLRLALRTGRRRGELLGLEWPDVDLERRIITVRRSIVRGITDSPKSNRIRHIPMTDDLYQALLLCKQAEGPVFQKPGGEPLSDGIMSEAIRETCEQAGLRHIGWHALRHTFASQLASGGAPITAIKELMGHSSLEMIMRYAHLMPTTLHRVVQILEEGERKEAGELGVQATLVG